MAWCLIKYSIVYMVWYLFKQRNNFTFDLPCFNVFLELVTRTWWAVLYITGPKCVVTAARVIPSAPPCY